MGIDFTSIIAKAKNGDQDAYAQLYEAANDQVYRTVLSMVKDEDTVLDIVQNAFVKGFSSLDTLQEPESFVPWMRRIAANMARDWFRKKHETPFSELTEEESGAVIDFKDDRTENLPEERLEQKERTRLIKEILDTLPEEQRITVGMFYYEDYTLSEIASELGVSENTVKSRLFYARKKIKTAVEDLEKKGTKLYGLSPVAFLVWLLKGGASASALLPAGMFGTIMAGVVAGSAAGTAAAAAGAAGVAGAGILGGILSTLGGKIATTAAAIILAGGITVAAVAPKSPAPINNVPTNDVPAVTEYTDGGGEESTIPGDVPSSETENSDDQVYCYVTFDPNGGTLKYSTNPLPVRAGEFSGWPKNDPVKDGYKFDYWMLDGEQFDFLTPITRDITLVAHWSDQIYHTVHFDFNGGEVDDTGRWDYLDSYDVRVADGDQFYKAIGGSVADNKPDLLSMYSPEGRAFKGWFDASGKQYLSMDVITSDLWLTAKWSVLNTDGESWTVYLDANGGEFDDFDAGRHISKASVKVLKGKSLSETEEFMSAATNKDDLSLRVPLHPLLYPFTGWYTTSGQKWDLDTPITGDLSLVAHWGTADDVTAMVYFKTNGGKFSNGKKSINFTVRNGSLIDEPETPTREGYVFDGWYYRDETKWDFATMKYDAYNGDGFFYAHWAESNEETTGNDETIPITWLSFNIFEFSTTSHVGDTGYITLVIEPADTTEDTTAVWTNSNPEVIELNGNRITALSPGTSIIRATVGNHVAYVEFTVVADEP